MLASLCFVVLLVVFYAALGRSATPPAERLPWTRWTAKDLLGNVVAGVRRLIELHERDPLTPHRRTPFHR
jgi:hypothetical protein